MENKHDALESLRQRLATARGDGKRHHPEELGWEVVAYARQRFEVASSTAAVAHASAYERRGMHHLIDSEHRLVL